MVGCVNLVKYRKNGDRNWVIIIQKDQGKTLHVRQQINDYLENNKDKSALEITLGLVKIT